MKKAFLFLITSLLLVALISCGAGEKPAETEESATYDFDFHGVTFALPKAYFAEQIDDGTLIHTGERGSDSSNIHLVLSEPGDIASYSRSSLDEIYSGKVEGFSGIDRYEQRNANGRDILIFSFVNHSGSGPLTQTQLIVFLPDSSVIATFTDDGSCTDTFGSIIDSIRITAENV